MLPPPLVKLASNATPGEARYVCLAGAGLSKDAGLPTAWDLMLQTAARLRPADQQDERGVVEWFLNSEYKDMSYSELIGGVYPTSVAQQSFIREQLKADHPGKPHKLLAELAGWGVFRCIITTNFDDLIEQALREVGLNVQVISNDDDLEHSEPLIHCKQFRVYKPHGTIGVGRLRNTPADLERLSPGMEEELTRVLSDHGLVVVGYSGKDPGIRTVFEQKKQRHYPTFWIDPREPAEPIPTMFGAEIGNYTYVSCTGASACLAELIAMYRKLADLVAAPGLPSSVVEAQEAIRSGQKDAKSVVKKFMGEILANLKAIAPDFALPGEPDDALVSSLEKSKPICCAFANVAQVIAENNASEGAMSMYKSFGGVLSEYNANPQVGMQGYRDHYFDFYKYIGHEMFVTMFSMLIREERWELIADLLAERLYAETRSNYRPDLLPFCMLSQQITLLRYRNDRLKRRKISLHAEMLIRERHLDGALGSLVPAEEFVAADYFLCLRAEAQEWQPEDRLSDRWIPWSALYMARSGPRFILEAKSKSHAEKLLKPLSLASVDLIFPAIVRTKKTLRYMYESSYWDTPMASLKENDIGRF